MTNFCIQNTYKFFVYKMYPTFWQTFVYILYTKFSWRSSVDFVYKMCTKVCWNVVYILHTSVAYVLYNSCILNVNTVSVWELSYKFGTVIHFQHHHIQDEAIYNQNMLWRHFALSLLLTFRVLARPCLMTLYIIFPTHVNSPITSRRVSKANIHRKKQLIVSHYRRKFFSKRGFYDITHACCIWLIFPFKATAS